MKITRLLIKVLILLGLIISSSLMANDLTNKEIIALTQADLLIHNSVIPPPYSEDWLPVTLTHHWTKQHYKQGSNGWYRFSVNLPNPPNTPWGIYLKRFNMNAAIYLNGQFLDDGGSFKKTISRNWNRPLYIETPSSLWQSGANIIYVRLKSNAQYGHLSPLFIGPTELLDTEYKQQYLFQIEISKALFPVMLAIGLFILGLWFKRREDTQYLWFSSSMLMWSIYSLNMFVVDQPFSTKTWEWIAHSSVDWWAILFCIFIFRFLNQTHPWLERSYLLFGFSACLTYALIDLETFNIAAQFFHGGSLVIGVITVAWLIQTAWKKRSLIYAQLATGLILLLLLGLHDWMFQFKVTSFTGGISLHLNYYFSPFIFFFMAWHLIGRFITALNEAETLNIELEARVLTAKKELKYHYQTIQKMESQQAVLKERERLSHEIHDGVSGNVSNAIMMTELLHRDIPLENRKRLQQLRTHLDDGLSEMRNLILTLEEDLSTTTELFSHITDKYEQVLMPLSINFTAKISQEGNLRTLSKKQSLNLLRILQEALNNIAKHAHAKNVSLEMLNEAGTILLTLTDDGKGFDSTQQSSHHYGLRNMHKRSNEINVNLTINSSLGDGTQIQLRLLLIEHPLQ